MMDVKDFAIINSVEPKDNQVISKLENNTPPPKKNHRFLSLYFYFFSSQRPPA